MLPCALRPPARRGDVYRALDDGYTSIVLIDGEFHGSPSVWHREIVEALAEGTTVHGASSMGALRAAELRDFGMIGHGRIFEWYRDGVIEADDEVALTYGPAELGYPSLSEPLVNIRATLAAAVPELISPADRDRLVACAKARYFPERSLAALLAGDVAAAWTADRRTDFARFLAERRIDQKRLDAMAALRAVAGAVHGSAPPRMQAARGALWGRAERLVAAGFAPTLHALDAAAVGQRAGIAPDELEALRRDLSCLFFVAAWARSRKLAAGIEDIALERTRFPVAIGLSTYRSDVLLAERALAAAATRAFTADTGIADPMVARRAIVLDWARENGVERPGLQGEALIDWVIEAGPNHFGYHWHFAIELAEALQLGGRAAALRLKAGS